MWEACDLREMNNYPTTHPLPLQIIYGERTVATSLECVLCLDFDLIQVEAKVRARRQGPDANWAEVKAVH